MSRDPALRREVLFQLTDVARAMRTYVDQRAREHGMTRAQWGVLLRLERQEGHDAGRNGRGPRDPADLACAPDRPAVRPGTGGAAPASRATAAPTASTSPTRAAPRSPARSLGPRGLRRTCWLRFSEAETAELLAEAAAHQEQHPQVIGTPTAPGAKPTGCAMLAKPSWLARVSARLDASKLPSLRLILLVLIPALVAVVASRLLSLQRPLRVDRQRLHRRPEGADHARGVGQGRAHRRGRGPAAQARRRAAGDRSRALSPGRAGGARQSWCACEATSRL